MKIFPLVFLLFAARPSLAQVATPDSASTGFTNSEGHELAHIAYALTTLARGSTGGGLPLDTTTAYFREVRRYFAPVRNHTLIGQLDERLRKKGHSHFVANRGTAVGLRFDEEGHLRYRAPGGFGYRLAHNVLIGNTFRREWKHWKSFAAQSNFREFYRTHSALYAQTLHTAARYLPVDRMVAWLETNFPGKTRQGTRQGLYTAISPLTGDLHSTMTDRHGAFWMFVSPLHYDTTKLAFARVEALYSGLLFTEIDHHYCNATGASAKRAKRVFANRTYWVDASKSAAIYYQDPVRVFNEYATHAAHLLYVRQTYDATTAAGIVENRIRQMETGRGFWKFDDFLNEWTRLAAADLNRKPGELYPALLDWCAQRAASAAPFESSRPSTSGCVK